MASSPQLPDNIETRKEINLEITQSCLDNGGHYKPPDFVIVKNDITYYLQMKKSATTERENRQDKLFDDIERNLRDIENSRFLNLFLSNDFTSKDVIPLVSMIEEVLESENYDQHCYLNEKVPKAEFEIVLPNKVNLDHVTFGITGDMDTVECTGEDMEQIKSGLTKAAKAFDWEIDTTNLNLIVVETDNKTDTDIAEACFGTERYYPKKDKVIWNRHNDGFFDDPEHNQKVAGVIAVRRNEQKPIPLSYSKTLFINERYVDRVADIGQIVDLNSIRHFNDFITE